MKRYGDNVTNEDLLAGQDGAETGEKTLRFLGGCAATYGSFPGPVNARRETVSAKELFARLSALLGLQREKSHEK